MLHNFSVLLLKVEGTFLPLLSNCPQMPLGFQDAKNEEKSTHGGFDLMGIFTRTEVTRKNGHWRRQNKNKNKKSMQSVFLLSKTVYISALPILLDFKSDDFSLCFGQNSYIIIK